MNMNMLHENVIMKTEEELQIKHGWPSFAVFAQIGSVVRVNTNEREAKNVSASLQPTPERFNKAFLKGLPQPADAHFAPN